MIFENFKNSIFLNTSILDSLFSSSLFCHLLFSEFHWTYTMNIILWFSVIVHCVCSMKLTFMKRRWKKETRRKEWVEDNHLTGNKVYCHSGGYPHSSPIDDATQIQRTVTQNIINTNWRTKFSNYKNVTVWRTYYLLFLLLLTEDQEIEVFLKLLNNLSDVQKSSKIDHFWRPSIFSRPTHTPQNVDGEVPQNFFPENRRSEVPRV